MKPRIKTLRFDRTHTRLELGAAVARLPSEQELASEVRAKLYASTRWRKESRAFLKQHPICATPGCRASASVVDHRDGHQQHDWLARFWDRTRWQAMCATCHAAKSGRELGAWRRTHGVTI
jgi:5-methylcytosine-specific restriction protein A